ncbi:hypothetical protein [Allokutzneria sp. NRRL B-24872]|uniref:hypothetical protein n=1 Tax=Allokutzneria sp. NRRL B-24872 TaxID=1137961 RepID=UPI001178926F|nr:hypothetical protein [Allokutzneria sp. NRRL B-24872]
MKIGRILGTAALALGMALVTVPSASAVNNPKLSCYKKVFCQLEFGGFPGGTLAVDADALNGPNMKILLILLRVQTETGHKCVTEFWAAEPARSWLCHNMPPGKIRVTTTEAYVNEYDFHVGARW